MEEQVGIRELKERTSAIVKRVRERDETVIITYRGRAVARIVPFEDASSMRAEGRRVWRAMDEGPPGRWSEEMRMRDRATNRARIGRPHSCLHRLIPRARRD